MRRSVKYGLYGGVLAAIVGGTVAWSAVDKTVTLDVDGKTQRVHTTADSVRQVLAGAGYQVGGHDVVTPQPSAAVHNGSRIVLDRGRLLQLTVDGHRRDAWVTAPTLADALDDLGYSGQDYTSLPRNAELPLTPTTITLRSPKQVTIRHDGTISTVTTTAANVGQVLAGAGVKLGAQDWLSVRPQSAPVQGERIVLTRVRNATVVETEPVAYATQRQSDPSLPYGLTQVVQPGRAGSLQVTYALTYTDGRLTQKRSLGTRQLAGPVAAVVHVGTAASTPDQAKAVAQQMLAARGWGADQFSCLDSLWTKESGWRTDAYNPSGAYGIPQSLPGDKMASVGADWQTNAATQITWGLNYIAGVYGTPCAAWAHSQATNWY